MAVNQTICLSKKIKLKIYCLKCKKKQPSSSIASGSLSGS